MNIRILSFTIALGLLSSIQLSQAARTIIVDQRPSRGSTIKRLRHRIQDLTGQVLELQKSMRELVQENRQLRNQLGTR